jgi:hypothetical protein
VVKLYRRDFIIQGALYVTAYLATYSFLGIVNAVVFFGNGHPSAWLITLTSIFYPLGGLFNILVYTRPKVWSLRRKHKGLSWRRAFITVVRAGGVVPMIDVGEDDRPPPHVFRGSCVELIDEISSIATPSVIISNVVSSISSGPSPQNNTVQVNLNHQQISQVLPLSPSPFEIGTGIFPTTERISIGIDRPSRFRTKL